MSIKNISRLRRAKKTRTKIKVQDSPRLTVFRSSKHFYAQVFESNGSKVLVSASTNEKVKYIHKTKTIIGKTNSLNRRKPVKRMSRREIN